MNDELLKVRTLCKNFDGVKALLNFTFSLKPCEILGLIGPNGAGKTTLFNIICGFMSPNSGKVVFKGTDISNARIHQIRNMGISRTFQDLRLIRRISVLDNVLLSFQKQSGEKLRNLFFNWQQCLNQENTNRKEAVKLLKEAGLVDKIFNPADELSYGQQKLLSLVCCLAAKGELLLLDEPVAGIAPDMIEKILEIIRDLPEKGKSIILIEHNLDAVMQICDKIIFMDAGGMISEGTPEQVRNDPRVIKAYIH